jgi:phage-related protein
MNLDAVLKVRADVQGQGEIDGLSKSFGNLNKQAQGAQGGLGRLGQAAKGIGGMLGALAPVGAIAGLGALAKRSIDAADDINDMSQRTGVAVETLSRFGQAAADSGSSIDGVAKGMGQLAKRITDPSSAASKALAGIGVATTDAQGKVRGLDAVMLDISDRFDKMPDGAEKSALAMQLFGKSGTELIPMLNEGRAALEQYQATISGDMAASADKFNDAINAIGREISGPFNQAVMALLPAITSIAKALVPIIDAFTKLPAPVQTLIVGITGLAAAFVILAPAISALITIGSAIAGLFAAGGALAGAGTILAGLATAFAVLITGPVGIVALLVAAGVAAYAFRDQIGAAFKAVVDFIGKAFSTIGGLLKTGAQAYMDYYVKPVLGFFKKLYDGVVSIFKQIGSAISGAFNGVVSTIKSVFRGVLQFLANQVNKAAGLVNVLIAAFNRLPAPDIPLIPKLTVPEFAQGGTVSRPTLAMVGEGGEREYIVPESKMARASANFLAGARGDAVLAGGGGGGAPTINITTGPVMEFNGERYVTVADMERAMRATANGVIGRLRTPSARIALGMA